MHHPDIEAWLQSRSEVQRLKDLECKAADVWFDSLSLEQREVFAELSSGHYGLFHLRDRITKARLEGRFRGE